MQHFIQSAGYLAVLLLAIGEAACLPIPSEVTMLFGGALAASGKVNLVGIIAVGVGGEVIGSYIGWWIGRTGGRPLIEKFGRYVLLSPGDLNRVEAFFAKRGPIAVLIGRVVPVVRTFISLVAGAARMKPLLLGIYTAVGSAVWMTGLGIAGYELGPQWQSISKDISGFRYPVIAVALLSLVVHRVHRYRKTQRAGVEVVGVTDAP